MTIEEFLQRVYDLDAEPTMDKAFDLVVEYTDDLYCAGEFAKADDVFAKVDADRISSSIVTILLRSSFSARIFLPSRPAFIAKVADKIIASRGEADGRKMIRSIT